MIFERHQILGGWRWRLVGTDLEPGCIQFSAGKWTAFVIGSYHPAVPSWLCQQIEHGKAADYVLSELWAQYDGHCAVVLFNENEDLLILGVDPYAIAKLYIYLDDNRWLISPRLAEILCSLSKTPPDLDPHACAFFLINGYTPASHTFYSKVAKVPPGTIVTIHDGKLEQNCYLNIDGPPTIGGDEYLHLVQQTWERSLTSYLDAFNSNYVALSGGIDSSLLLASLIKLGADRNRCVAKTAVTYGGDSNIELNQYDKEFAIRVAKYFNVRHETSTYNWSDKHVLSDFLRTVKYLGTEATVSASIFQTLVPSSYSPDVCLCAAQNADSIFSFTATGWPKFKATPPFVSGLGGWTTRFNLFGGLDRNIGLKGIVARTLLDVYLRRHYRVRLNSRTPEDRLSGMAFNSLKWPIHLSEEDYPYISDIPGLAAWFKAEYIARTGLMSLFNTNPHASFVSLFLHTFMQGSDNRGTAWPVSMSQMPTFLPFASLGILRLTAKLIPDSRFYWFGKFPVLWLARNHYGVPEWVIRRRDPLTTDMDHLMYKTFFENADVYEYLRSFLLGRVQERFSGIVKEAYLNTLVEQFENRRFDRLDLKLLSRLFWILTLEREAEHNRREVV